MGMALSKPTLPLILEHACRPRRSLLRPANDEREFAQALN
jgi:hypothetical protein